MKMDGGKIQEELEFLLEEDNRVITYKFVSSNFGIHVNAAKRHLQSLLGACRSRGDDEVSATFYLSGFCDDRRDYVSQKALVVSEQGLAAARRSMAAVTSEHVFSLQRRPAVDTAALCASDRPAEEESHPAILDSYGAIVCRRAERLPERPLLKTGPPDRHQPKPQLRPAEGHNTKPAKSQSAAKGNSNIASMFANAETEKKPAKGSPKKPAGGGMMASFLLRGAERTASAGGDTDRPAVKAEDGTDRPAVKAADRTDPPPVKAEDGTDRPPVKAEDGTDRPPVKAEDGTDRPAVKAEDGTDRSAVKAGDGTDRPVVKAVEPGQLGAKASSGGKRPGRSGGAQPAKRRRRIQMVASDSSDSSEEEDEGRAEEPEPEPEPQPEQVPPQQTRRKRRLVTKTFVDDEGFMVTKKEYESCSGSESEEPRTEKAAAVEKNPPVTAPAETTQSSSKSKEVSRHKVKQAGIMSFFKKK